MQLFEYSVVTAPDKGDKNKGAKTPGDRFAQALSTVLNDMAVQGWEYVRADTLPTEERSGLTGRATLYHNVLVFRRAVQQAQGQTQANAPAFAAKPARTEPAPKPAPTPVAEKPVTPPPIPEAEAEKG